MNWSAFIKKLLALDVIWGGRTKKMTGINDALNYFSGNINCIAGTQTIDFNPGTVPSWIIVSSYLRFVSGGGTNNGYLFQVISKTANSVTVIPGPGPLLVNFTGFAVLDGRIFAVVNDPNIARQSSTGGTMFNANATAYSGPSAGNVIFNRVDHFHTNDTSQFDGNQIVTHEYTPAGSHRVQYDTYSDTFVAGDPAVVIDNNGNVVVI